MRDHLQHTASTLGRIALKAPIHAYRWTLKPFFGWHCRHLPTCSEYALEAVDKNGPWRGVWLIASRLWRCRPGGTAGYDPVPDIKRSRFLLMPWRYGRWMQCYEPVASDSDTTTRDVLARAKAP